jgi:short-subunit dehydrogenase
MNLRPVRTGVMFALICHVVTWIAMGISTYFALGDVGGVAFALLCLHTVLLGFFNHRAHFCADTFKRGLHFCVAYSVTSMALLIGETLFVAFADLAALEPHSSFFAGLGYIVFWMAWLYFFALDVILLLIQSLVWARRARQENKRLQILRGVPMKKIAVITGASSGMGRDFARQLDAQQEFDEIWLIARRRERLEEMASELRAPVRAIALDLTKEESIAEYSALLAAENPRIAVLVNAAGFGRFGKTEDFPIEDHYRMIDLNTKALVGMTVASLPCLGEGSQIYQLGSMSSFQPVPYINTYGATKAFVLSFTRALNVEWKKRGIRQMAVCPHWVKTEFFDHAVKDDTICYYNKFYTSEEVVTRALRDMKRGKDVSICGFSARAQAFGVKMLPHKLIMKIWCKQQKK